MTFRITLADGRDIYGPDENADAMLQALDQAGIKYLDASTAPAVEGKMQVGAPEVIKGPTPADPEAATAQQEVGDAPKPAFEYPGWLKALAGDHSPSDDFRATSQALSRAGEDPIGTMARGGAGYVGNLVGGALPFAGGELGPVANAALQAGAAKLKGSSDALTDGSDWISALAGAGNKEAALAGGLAGTFGLAGAAAQKLANGAGAIADKARAYQWGITPQMLTETAENQGITPGAARSLLVKQGEDLVPPGLLPRSANTWAGKFGDARESAGQQIGDAINAAQDEGVPFSTDASGDAARALYNQADAAMTSGRYSQQQLAQALSREAHAIEMGPPIDSPLALRQAKTAMESDAYGGGARSEEASSALASRAAADQYRGMLQDYMMQASPETMAAFQQGNQNYGLATELQQAAAARAAAQPGMSPGISGLGGGSLGAAMGAAMGGGPMGMAIGAPLGMLVGIGGRNMALTYGPDAAANGARWAQSAMQATANANNALGRIPYGLMGGGAAPQGAMAQDADTAPQAEAKRIAETNDDSRGFLIGDSIAGTLASNPGMLGQYAKEFANVTDPRDMGAIAERLYYTDPQFASQYYPMLLEHTMPKDNQ